VLNFEGRSLSDFTFSASGLGEDIFTVVASNDSLGVAKDNVGFATSSAFDIHEVGVGSWDKSGKLVGLSFVLE
jgi:hypothetical protein